MKKITIEISDDEVLVALKRHEGYEDVHPELVAEDAIKETWPEYRTVSLAACPYFTMPSECGRPKCRENGCIDPNVEYPKEITP